MGLVIGAASGALRASSSTAVHVIQTSLSDEEEQHLRTALGE